MMARWWRRRQQPANTWSVSDPAFAEFFHVGYPNYSGVQVSEHSALAISAFYRAGAIISSTIAGLPLRTMRDKGDGTRERAPSLLDDPGGPDGPTPFGWKETVVWHLFLHGDAFLQHVFNGAGSIAALVPLHPQCVSVEWADVPGGKRYTATLLDGTRKEFDRTTLTHIMGPTADGLRGMSIITIARNSLGTAIAGDRAAAKVFSSGALYSGIVSPDGDDVDEADAKIIKESLNASAAGWENAGEIAVVNRRLKFQPWTMSLADAQFIESRQFQVQEIARWTGVPGNLLMDPGAVSTWGTGVEIQNRGLSRFTLQGYTSRMEETLSRLLPRPRFCEFDYAGLLQPAPEVEVPLLIQQVQAGLMTPNEARRMRGMDPIDGGDVLRGQAAPAPTPEAVPA